MMAASRGCIFLTNSGRFVRFYPKINNLSQYCWLASQASSSPRPEIEPPGKIKAFIVKKYVNYLEKFDATFGQKYPKVYKIYRLFKDGIRDFFADVRTYYSVATEIWSGRPLSTFTLKELITYQQVPGDMLRSAPVLIAVPLPFLPYVVFPLAYMFPRQFLCRHFWTPQQKLDFAFQDLKHRFVHYSKIINYLEAHASSIEDTGNRKIFIDILRQISSDQHPDVEAILKVKDVFTMYPFGMDYLFKRHKIHLWRLCRSFDISSRKSKLIPSLAYLHHIDLAILRHGIDKLCQDDLQQLSFARGLNAINVEDEDLRIYLRNWTTISKAVDRTSYSLLLHCPVLLSSTWPSNTRHLAFLKNY